MLAANIANNIANKTNEEKSQYNQISDSIVRDVLSEIEKREKEGHYSYWYCNFDEYNCLSSKQIKAMQILRDLGYAVSFRGLKGYLIRW
jgi:hypothetical protein